MQEEGGRGTNTEVEQREGMWRNKWDCAERERGKMRGEEGSCKGVNPAGVWPGIIYANIITSAASRADKQRG